MRVSGSKSAATAALAVLLSLSTACTTMRPITADASGEQVRLELKPGDTVHVVTKDGASHSFKVDAVGASSLAGKTVKLVGISSTEGWGAPIDVPYTDIAQIEVRRGEGLATVGVVAAVAVAVVAIAAGEKKPAPRTSASY